MIITAVASDFPNLQLPSCPIPSGNRFAPPTSPNEDTMPSNATAVLAFHRDRWRVYFNTEDKDHWAYPEGVCRPAALIPPPGPREECPPLRRLAHGLLPNIPHDGCFAQVILSGGSHV